MKIAVPGAFLLLASAVVCGIAGGNPSAAEKSGAPVDVNGNIHVPNDYRTTFQFLGSWAVSAEQGRNADEFHVVYASPGAIESHRRHGTFPNDTTIIKEVFHAKSDIMTTGAASRAENLKGWFVMVKDSENRRTGNAVWGDGWGWSWFDAANSYKAKTSDYKAECQGCHIPAQATDWIYTEGYPALKP